MIRKFFNLGVRFFLSSEKYARKKGVKIGKGCYISTKNFPTEASLIEIGDYVRIAKKTAFFTHGGIWSLRKIYNDPTLDYFGKIKIGSYTYIGEGCLIMPGVTIGEKCIIGAATVLTRSVPDGCMVAGNPAKIIGRTDNFYNKIKLNDFKTGGMKYKDKIKFISKVDDSLFVIKPNLKLN